MTLEISQYDAVELQEYQGNYSLIACAIGKKDPPTYYPRWALYRKKRDEYQEKDWPVKVSIGNKEQAVLLCLAVLSELTGKEYEPKSGDIPY